MLRFFFQSRSVRSCAFGFSIFTGGVDLPFLYAKFVGLLGGFDDCAGFRGVLDRFLRDL